MADIGGGSATVEVSVGEHVADMELPGPRVVITLRGPGGVQTASLGAGEELVIGRRLPADLVMGEGSLSRQHARVAFDGEQLWVTDLSSRNGTWVGGTRLTAGELVQLAMGQAVRLGAACSMAAHLPSVGSGPGGVCASVEEWLPLLREELRRVAATGGALSVFALRTTEGEALLSALPALVPALGPLDRLALATPSRALLLCPGCGERQVEERGRALVAALEAKLVAGAALASPGSEPATLVAQAKEACMRANGAAPVHVMRAEDLVDARKAGEPVGDSDAMRRLLRQARKAAAAPVSVLVQGETGTGKEVIARYLHAHSPRAGKPLVTVNCGAIPETLLSSTLFGHMRGAFTGASETRPGLFEQAHGGTLFLDEIGELSLEAQVSLLRVLETRKVTRVGSAKEIEVDVRVVAATHRNLEARVQEGTFREDLLYRLNSICLHIAPLRERLDDVPALVTALLSDIAQRFSSPVPAVDDRTMEVLRGYAYPGNVRELRNVLEHAVVQCEDARICVVDLPERVLGKSAVPAASEAADDAGLSFKERIELIEMDFIRKALHRHAGNQTKAASDLQIPRRTLVHKLRAYGMQGEVW